MLDLVKQMDELSKERKKLMSELPRNYVIGSDAYKKQAQKLENDYHAEVEAIRNRINMELAKVEAKAKTIQTIHATNSAPTTEEIESGYKIIDVISKTSNSISEDTLTRLVGKVKDFDEALAQSNDELTFTVMSLASALDNNE